MEVSVTVHPNRLQLVQSLTLVLRLPSQPPMFDGPAAVAGWSLGRAFNAQLAGACPLARISRAYVQLPGGAAEGAAALRPPPAASALLQGVVLRGQLQAVHSYELRELLQLGGQLDIAVEPGPAGQQQDQGQQGQQGQALVGQPPLQVHSYTTGSGNLHGGMVLELTRQPGQAANATLPVCIFQVVPWYVRVWLHTLQLRVDGRPVELDALVTARRLVPAQDRRQQLELELCLQLPAASRQLLLTADFSKAFLTVFECPPDTHRGHDVPAAVVSYPDEAVSGRRGLQCEGAAGGGPRALGACAAALAGSPLLRRLAEPRVQQQRSQGLLVPLAAPDFSMPYNVGAAPAAPAAV
jgi:phosphatidylinositol glycan class T